MSTSPTPIRPLTFDIGETERTLRALLDRRLDKVGLTFAQWTALVFLDGGEPLTGREVVQRQVAGRVAPEATLRAAVERLQSAGLVGSAEGLAEADGDEPRLAITADGEAVFRPLRQTVSVATAELFGDLPAEDLEATRRTLHEITRRATAKLAEPAA